MQGVKLSRFTGGRNGEESIFRKHRGGREKKSEKIRKEGRKEGRKKGRKEGRKEGR